MLKILTTAILLLLIVPYAASAANVMWLKFDETSGTTASDSSGYGNIGTLHGGSWVTGRSGNALHLDQGTYVVVDDSSSLNLANGFTAEAWVRAATTGEDGRWIFSKGYPHTTNYEGFMIQLWSDNQCYNYVAVNNQFYNAIVTYPFPHDNQYHHIAQTVEQSGSNVIKKAYLDGILQSEKSITGAITDTDIGMAIGGYNFVGEIDEARLHNRSLSPYEIFEYVHSDSVSYFNIENSKIRMRIASSGFIESLYDKNNSRELLAGRQRFFQYSVGAPDNISYFTNVSMAGNDLHLLDVTQNVEFVLNVSTDDDYIMFTVRSASVPAALNLTSLVLKLGTNFGLMEVYGPWNFNERNYVGDQKFTLISMPLSPNVYSGVSAAASTWELLTTFRAYPAVNSMPGSRMIFITMPASAASFEREDILSRLKTKLNMRQSSLSDIYPTLFIIFNESEASAVGDFAANHGFKNVLIQGGGIYGPGWNRDDGYWDVNTDRFPSGINGLKTAVDTLHAKGLKVGLHLLPTLLHPNNSILGSNPDSSIYVLKYPDGTAYHPIGVYFPTWTRFYVVNCKNDGVMDTIATNYANVINQLGVDMVYFDGSEIVGTEAVGEENVNYYNNKYIDILLSKLRNNISVQIVFPFSYNTMQVKRQSLADGIDYFKNPNAIKDWIDNTAINWIVYYRYHFLNPELGWMWYHAAKNVSEYAYALSASIALAAPLVLEGDWNRTFVQAFGSPNYTAFENVLDTYLPVFNRYAGRTILKLSLFYPYGADKYVFTQYESGLAGFFVNDSTDLPAGKNRNVWIHVAQNKNVLVNLKFTALARSRRYALERNGASSNVFSDGGGNLTSTLNLGSTPAYNFLRLYISADLNDDGIVDIIDLMNISTHFGQASGFDINIDVSPDNRIDIFDLVFVASRFT